MLSASTWNILMKSFPVHSVYHEENKKIEVKYHTF